MGAARRQEQDGNERHESEVKARLEEVIRAALREHLTLGRRPSTDLLEAAVESVVDAVYSPTNFVIGIRRPRPGRQSHRALMLRLPEPGVEVVREWKGKKYVVRVTGPRTLELVKDTGQVLCFRSLKAVACEILGYMPSVGGWQWFFGGMEHEEVSAKYGKKSP